MKLHWSTFVLEIINFIVLIWLLKRFFYKPILSIIHKRREAIEKEVADSKRMRAEAQIMQAQYEKRIADWEQEKAQAYSKMREEVMSEREKLMTTLRASIEEERNRLRVIAEERFRDLERESETIAIRQSGRFLTALLSRLASPELESRLIGLFLEDFSKISKEDEKALADNLHEEKGKIQVTSAFPIAEGNRQAIASTLNRLYSRGVEQDFREDSKLIAGLQVRTGSWVLRASLKDELRFFIEAAPHAGPAMESEPQRKVG